MNHSILSAVVLAFAVLIGLSGCGKTSQSTPSDRQTVTDDHDHSEPMGDMGHMNTDGDAQSDMDKMMAELAKLSPADQASAMAQHYCPVSGEMLGVMGPPIKLDVNGQTVWICCEDCRDEVMNNPDEYLAKLKKE